MKLILASKSPRRQELLSRLGLEFEVRGADSERPMDPNGNVINEVAAVAAAKANAVPAAEGELVIASDTVVELDGKVLGKPKDREDAIKMLTALSGKTHRVHTAVTLKAGEREETRVSTTAVTFRSLSQEEIAAYADSGEPMDKAGSYGIQGLGALLIDGIQGDYFTVVGLPLGMLGQMLKNFGITIL